MRMLRIAALAAASVGLGLFAVGCGPVTLPTVDTSKAGKELAKASEKVGGEADKLKEDAKKLEELTNKLKTAGEDANKELGPIDAAMKALGAKIGEEKDEAKLAPLKKIETQASGMLGDIKTKIGDLAKLKDLTSLDGAKAAITAAIGKLKDLLAAYLPK